MRASLAFDRTHLRRGGSGKEVAVEGQSGDGNSHKEGGFEHDHARVGPNKGENSGVKFRGRDAQGR